MRELPPNCPFFQDGRFVLPESDTYPIARPAWKLDGAEAMKPIIASVARSYWLDHAASVRGAAGMSSDPFGVHATIRPNPEWLHAMKQADLWAKWGKNAD